MQLTDAEWEFIGPYLPDRQIRPVPRTAAAAVRGRDLALPDGWAAAGDPQEFGAWSTVHDRFRQWWDAGVFQALLEGLIAEAAKRGDVDLSLVSVDSTSRAHHDAAGMHLAPDAVAALAKAAAEDDKGRQRGAARRSKVIRTLETTRHGKNADAPGADTSSG
ncbi:transposase [Streptomyces sp. NPDC003758]